MIKTDICPSIEKLMDELIYSVDWKERSEAMSKVLDEFEEKYFPSSYDWGVNVDSVKEEDGKYDVKCHATQGVVEINVPYDLDPRNNDK